MASWLRRGPATTRAASAYRRRAVADHCSSDPARLDGDRLRRAARGVLVPLWLVLASAGLALPNVAALALGRHDEAAGTAAALLGAVQFGLGALAAPLVGVLGTGVVSMAIVIAVGMLGATAVLLVVRPWRRPFQCARVGGRSRALITRRHSKRAARALAWAAPLRSAAHQRMRADDPENDARRPHSCDIVGRIMAGPALEIAVTNLLTTRARPASRSAWPSARPTRRARSQPCGLGQAVI